MKAAQWEEVMKSDADLIVMATTEPLADNRVLLVGPRRFRVVRGLTRSQYDEARARNARVRAEQGRPRNVWTAEGESCERLQLRAEPAADPPAEARFYYWMEEL